jgi:nicotinate-nucleotide adenylyltransferase
MISQGLILFGGSFDPVHQGHLMMAAFAMRYLHAEKLIFIPAARSPLKTAVPVASGQQRMDMIRLAIEGQDCYQVSDCELIRTQPSYTIDTIRQFRNQYGPTVPLYWLVGADALSELARWSRIEELLDLCRICILYRAGFDIPSLQVLEGQLSPVHIQQLARDVIATPLVDVSSTQIRGKIAHGLDIGALLPPSVWQFIQINGLYGCRNPHTT